MLIKIKNMGFWILSIIIVVALAVGIGYGLYGITKLFKDFDKSSGEVCGGFAGISVGGIGMLIVLFSMTGSCTSKYSTYESLFLGAVPFYLFVIGLIIIGFFLWYFVSNRRELSKKDKKEEEFLLKHGISKK